jgi:hypothetical protein
LLWPLTKEKTEGILQAVEKQKSLLLIALENYHLLLSAEIKKDTTTIRQDLEYVQKDIQGVADTISSLDRNLHGIKAYFNPFRTAVVWKES